MNDDRWVDERLATLSAGGEWQPDVNRGLARLREGRGATSMRGRRWTWAIAGVAAAGLCLVALPAPRVLAQRCLDCTVALWQSLSNSGPARADIKPEADRKVAPDFTLNDASGQPVTLTSFKGKVVLLNFWATWCAPCAHEIPWFIEFQRNYGDRDFVALGVSLDDDGWKSVQPFVDGKKINYPIMIGGADIAALYGGIETLPTTLIIDQSGRIAATHVGLVGKSDYQAEIETLLNRK